jgi:glycerophosphoryl diester phosphodiesterase
MNALLDLDRHPVVGHRGASGLAPENTLEAFALALSQGADALELDVRVSADGVPVVVHDATLGRTTEDPKPVAGLITTAILSADAGYRFPGSDPGDFPWRGRGVRIPTLRQVLERFPDTPVLIELKVVEAVDPVRRLLAELQAAERVVIGSFLEAALAPFRAAPFQTSAARPNIARLWVRSLLGLSAPRIPDQVYAVPDRYRNRLHVPTARFIRAARAAGQPVHVWTVNDPTRAVTLWNRGASGMITNFPALLRTERDRLFPGERVSDGRPS